MLLIVFILLIVLVFLCIFLYRENRHYKITMKQYSEQTTKAIDLLKSDLHLLKEEKEVLNKQLLFYTEIEEDSKKIAIANDSNSQDINFNLLDNEQKFVFDLMDRHTENLFVTGKAGTGKSYLLEVFVNTTKKRCLKLAPTGIAAKNIGGATLHSTFGYKNLVELNYEDICEKNLILKSEKRIVLQKIDVIIIDEISMVRADIFDRIDKILRVLNDNNKPFGGKQIILFGDLFQLPPIANYNEEKYLFDHYGGIHFIYSNAYKNSDFRFIELTINHRQKEDEQYFEILNRIRDGSTTSEDTEILNQRVIANLNELRRMTTLYSKKADAEKKNRTELDKIDSKEYIYESEVSFNETGNQKPNLEAIFPIVHKLYLKKGALVMMVANDANGRWVNGTMAIVKDLKKDKIFVAVQGYVYEVYRSEFVQQEAIYVNNKIQYKDTLKVEQFPIVLAYAITIHKSQGLTYKKMACDISGCFAPGQAYVALSRCGSLSGLNLLTNVNKSMIRTDDNILEFYRRQTREIVI